MPSRLVDNNSNRLVSPTTTPNTAQATLVSNGILNPPSAQLPASKRKAASTESTPDGSPTMAVFGSATPVDLSASANKRMKMTVHGSGASSLSVQKSTEGTPSPSTPNTSGTLFILPTSKEMAVKGQGTTTPPAASPTPTSFSMLVNSIRRAVTPSHAAQTTPSGMRTSTSAPPAAVPQNNAGATANVTPSNKGPAPLRQIPQVPPTSTNASTLPKQTTTFGPATLDEALGNLGTDTSVGGSKRKENSPSSARRLSEGMTASGAVPNSTHATAVPQSNAGVPANATVTNTTLAPRGNPPPLPSAMRTDTALAKRTVTFGPVTERAPSSLGRPPGAVSAHEQTPSLSPYLESLQQQVMGILCVVSQCSVQA